MVPSEDFLQTSSLPCLGGRDALQLRSGKELRHDSTNLPTRCLLAGSKQPATGTCKGIPMYKKSLLGLGVVAIVGMALGACSGPATSPDTASAKPSEKAAQTKRYSNGELLDLVKQIKTADGTSLTTVSGEELWHQLTRPAG